MGPKINMYQKALLIVIASSSTEKNLYDQSVDSNTKRYKGLRKSR